MTKKSKWKKRLLIIIVSLTGIILVLFIVFNQLIYALLIGIGSIDMNYGNNERGNKIMSYALSKIKKPSGNTYYAISVQNTKNGNYSIAIPALEKAYKMNPEGAGPYYGWVLLYYYHDYEKSLNVLNIYDDSTPSFSDYPMGECIHYLKGLAYKQLENHEEAVKEFDLSIKNQIKENSEDWIDYQIFLNKGISLFHLKKYKEAIIELERTLKNYDKCSEAFYFIGLSNLKLDFNELACENLKKADILISQGYKSSDDYVELFHEIYKQEVDSAFLKNCIN